MNNKKTHIYFVPGLAADKEIFENISLPENLYTLHIISWLIPSKKETIAQYAKRMAGFVTEKNAVLVGVSFGGGYKPRDYVKSIQILWQAYI